MQCGVCKSLPIASIAEHPRPLGHEKKKTRYRCQINLLNTRSMAMAHIKCKILLPRFDTWEHVHLERENIMKLHSGDTTSDFFGP